MLSLIIFLFCFLLVIAVGGYAAWSDFRSMKIPNWCSLIILGAFVPVFVILWLQTGSWLPFILSHGLALLVMFLLSFALFAFKLLGAGDSKLASAFALWVGLKGLAAFLVVMTLVGALLALCALVIRKYKPLDTPLPDSWIDQVQQGKSKVPYGIAIWIGALIGFYQVGFFDVAFYQSFLG